MLQDEILDEIRQVREEHTKSFNYDLNAMFADWQRRQTEGGRKVVSLSPKYPIVSRWSRTSKNIASPSPQSLLFKEEEVYKDYPDRK